MLVSGGLNPLASCDDRFFSNLLDCCGERNNNGGKELSRDHLVARTETRHDFLLHGDLLQVSLLRSANVKDQTAFGSTVILF